MNRPIVFYAISIFIGCLSMMIFCKYTTFIAIIFAISFILIIYFTNRPIFTVIITGFLFCGIFSFKLYFEYYPKKYTTLRVIKKYDHMGVGTVKGRKVYIKGNINDLKEGEKIKVIGKFKKVIIYEKGIVGSYYVKQYSKMKHDYIYKVNQFKYIIQQEFNKYLGKDKSLIVTSLCFGGSSTISETDKLNLQKLGVIHAISVSGFHLAIIYKMVQKILGIKFGIIISFIYTVFTGMQYSTIRAFIMIVILKLAKIVYKNYDSLSALSLAFIIIICLKPYAFMEVGFMLSFLATLGIILFSKKIGKIFNFIPNKLSNCISISISAQIFILPYVAYTLKNFSLGFLLGNIFLMPIYSILIVLGNLAVIFIKFNYIFRFLNYIINYLCYALDGANYILLKICPNLMYLGEKEGLCICIIYMSFIMMKKGDKKFKYIPIIALIALMCSYYTLFPELYTVRSNKLISLIIKYKNENIMVCSSKTISNSNIEKIKNQFNVENVISHCSHNIRLHISANIDIIICNENNKIKKVFIINNKKHNYDIIYLDKNKIVKYKIVFGKVLMWR